MSAFFQLLSVTQDVLKNRKKMMWIVFLVAFVPSFFGIRRLPQRFQSSALFNFHSDFAKIPASSEFFPEMYDPNEIRSEKEAILLGVLSDDFLHQLSLEYIGEEAAETEWIVQGLRKDIRFVPLSRTTYQLVVKQRSPEVTQNIAIAVLQRLEMTLRHERVFRMKSVYKSVTQQISEISAAGYDQDLTSNRESARLEIEAEIRKLEGLYTSEHPRLAGLRHQANALRQFKKKGELDPFERSQLENWSSLRGVLILRQALLQVALRMEEDGNLSQIKIVKEPDLPRWPVEPKKSILYATAFGMSGVLAAVVAVAFSVTKDADDLFPDLMRRWSAFRAQNQRKNRNFPSSKS